MRTKSKSLLEMPVRTMISAASMNRGRAISVKELMPENMRMGMTSRLAGLVMKM